MALTTQYVPKRTWLYTENGMSLFPNYFELPYSPAFCRSALSAPEKLDYTDSVQCLMLKPSVIPPGLAPGAISHYDDFVATHINKTLLVHNNGIFISWHRHFLYLFEKALKDECGFKGTLPYWNWPWWAEDLINSPIFDGSETSLGGDGAFNATRDVPRFGNITFPTGNGGGCVASGPFKECVHLSVLSHSKTNKTPAQPSTSATSPPPTCSAQKIHPARWTTHRTACAAI